MLLLSIITLYTQEVIEQDDSFTNLLTINFNLIGIKSGYAINIDSPATDFPLITLYFMNLEILPPFPIPGVGIHPLSVYYFDHGSSIGLRPLPYIIIPIINTQDRESILTYLDDGFSFGPLERNFQLNLMLDAMFRAGQLSQILIDDNITDISAYVIWGGLRAVYRLNSQLSLDFQVGYLHYWDPGVPQNNHGFIEIQTGICYGSSCQLFKSNTEQHISQIAKERQPQKSGQEDAKPWYYKFEYQGLARFLYCNPTAFNNRLSQYNFSPIQGGLIAGGIFTNETIKDWRLGFFMMSPIIGEFHEDFVFAGQDYHRHTAYYDFCFILLKSFDLSDNFCFNIGAAVGFFYYDEIGVVNKTTDTRLIKYTALPGPSIKAVVSFDWYFVTFADSHITIGLTAVGSLNFMYCPKGWVVDEEGNLIEDFPEIDFSGFQVAEI